MTHVPQEELISIAKAAELAGMSPTSLYTYTKGKRKAGVLWHTMKDGTLMLRRSDALAIKAARDERTRSGVDARAGLDLARFGVTLLDSTGRPMPTPGQLTEDHADAEEQDAAFRDALAPWPTPEPLADPDPNRVLDPDAYAAAYGEIIDVTPEPLATAIDSAAGYIDAYLSDAEPPPPTTAPVSLTDARDRLAAKRHHLQAQVATIDARIKPLQDDRELLLMELEDVDGAAAKLADVERVLGGF